MGVRETFEALVGDLDYPMFVVTAAADGEVAGCLVGFTTQTSIDPPRFLVCVSRRNRTYGVATQARVLGVHVVPAGGERIAELFGGETGDDVDKLAQVGWREGPDGVPLLDACPTRFAGHVLDRLDAGDHCAFLLEPVAAERDPAAGELTFHRAKGIEPGHEA